jgi:hypothetical protein
VRRHYIRCAGEQAAATHGLAEKTTNDKRQTSNVKTRHLSAAKDLKIATLRSFAVFAAQDDGNGV